MLTRAKFRVCYLACDKPENNCEMPELPYSSNVNELLLNKRPPKALIPRLQTKLDRVHVRLITT